MKKIKLMPDYGCFPIWGMEDDNFGNIDPYSLLISKSLAEELLEWAHKYDKTLNIDEPLNSRFENIEKENILGTIYQFTPTTICSIFNNTKKTTSFRKSSLFDYRFLP